MDKVSPITPSLPDILGPVALPLNQMARRICATEGAKLVARTVSRSAAKRVVITMSSPWMLVADGVEVVSEQALITLYGVNELNARRASAVGGCATSVAIGAALGGPVGAAAGLASWGIGKAIETTMLQMRTLSRGRSEAREEDERRGDDAVTGHA